MWRSQPSLTPGLGQSPLLLGPGTGQASAEHSLPTPQSSLHTLEDKSVYDKAISSPSEQQLDGNESSQLDIKSRKESEKLQGETRAGSGVHVNPGCAFPGVGREARIRGPCPGLVPNQHPRPSIVLDRGGSGGSWGT